ncbi:MAG: Nif11-like leader peptide family natural product precursor [Ruminiclostridium sp.]|nr:Nif11-like leader peptide family natural product precursor [Ruminiclostridium sp.]
MSKEIAKKLITELETNEELGAKVAGVTDPNELLKIANESGYDVTIEELIEAEKEGRKSKAAQTDEKLSFDDLEGVAGGSMWRGDDAPDGHEIGCKLCYHGIDWCSEHDTWCSNRFYCTGYLI